MPSQFEWDDFVGTRPGARPDPHGAAPLSRLRAIGLRLFYECPIGLLTLDHRTGLFRAVNREFTRITGYTQEESLKLSYRDVLAPEDQARVADFRRRRLQGDPTLPQRYEILVLTRSGERKVVVFTVGIVPFSDVLLAAIQDVTAERLTAEPLLHAQKIDSLAVLAGGMANEFNNLLATISGYAELALTRSSDRPDVAKSLGKIVGAVAEAVKHVESLLSFARSGSNALESLDPGKLVHSILSVLPSAAGRQLSLITQGLDNLGQVRGDSSQLEQALFNVLLNAAEALEPESGTIRVHASLEEITSANDLELMPAQYVRIDVTDDGCGIPAESRARVFHPYFTTKAVPTHSGLGLSTAHGIVREHGGAIILRSELNQGTSVSVLLPSTLEPSRLVPAPLDSNPAPVPRAKTILIVDDLPHVAELFRDILENQGYTATCETSAIAALQKVTSEEIKPDLAIVDLMMPDLPGRELVRALRRSDGKLPILITSGYSGAEVGDHELKAMTSGFLRKPFSQDELLGLVGRALRSEPDEEV